MSWSDTVELSYKLIPYCNSIIFLKHYINLFVCVCILGAIIILLFLTTKYLTSNCWVLSCYSNFVNFMPNFMGSFQFCQFYAQFCGFFPFGSYVGVPMLYYMVQLLYTHKFRSHFWHQVLWGIKVLDSGRYLYPHMYGRNEVEIPHHYLVGGGSSSNLG